MAEYSIALTNRLVADKKAVDSLGVALIGAGMIAERHVTDFSAMRGDARLLAVVSRHTERARHLASSYEGPVPLCTSDLSDVIQNPEIQVAIAATPPSVIQRF